MKYSLKFNRNYEKSFTRIVNLLGKISLCFYNYRSLSVFLYEHFVFECSSIRGIILLFIMSNAACIAMENNFITSIIVADIFLFEKFLSARCFQLFITSKYSKTSTARLNLVLQ